MARITVQDCLEQVENRFELVLTSARRARNVSLGSEARVPRQNDKPSVIALREIAEGVTGREVLDEAEPRSSEVVEVRIDAPEDEESEAGELPEDAAPADDETEGDAPVAGEDDGSESAPASEG